MASDLIDGLDHDLKARVPAPELRKMIDTEKYDDPLRCAKCGGKFVYDDEVWAIATGNDGEFIGDQYMQYNHYDCEVANK